MHAEYYRTYCDPYYTCEDNEDDDYDCQYVDVYYDCYTYDDWYYGYDCERVAPRSALALLGGPRHARGGDRDPVVVGVGAPAYRGGLARTKRGVLQDAASAAASPRASRR